MAADNHNKQHGGGHHGGGHFIVPMSVYAKIFGALVFFTVVTVASSYIDFGGSTNILIAMGIATTKALLVILFFMGLKYDDAENKVTFFMAFLFLLIFVALTGADLFFRENSTPAAVDASDLIETGPPADIPKLAKSGPELKDKGHSIYMNNCATCHGPEGKGDGPAAAALSTKPRNFTSTEGWKNGRNLGAVAKTITLGLPGTPMPSFAGLKVDDRFALAHYVRSLAPGAPEPNEGEIAQMQKDLGGPAKARIPVMQALEAVAREYEAQHH